MGSIIFAYSWEADYWFYVSSGEIFKKSEIEELCLEAVEWHESMSFTGQRILTLFL
jgi:hypothetical protein